MIRLFTSCPFFTYHKDLNRLLLLKREGKVGYRWGREAAELETMDYHEFIARVVSPIPDRGQVTVRYGL